MTDVSKFYRDVIEDVIGGVKDELIEEGLDMQVLEELKKLWIAKLEDTHVFDPEPVHNSAAQYLNLVQRSQLGTRVLISTQPPTNTISSTDPVIRPVGLPGSLGDVRATIVRPAAVPVEHGLTRVQLHPQPVMTLQQQHHQQQQRLPQQTLVATAPGVVTANTIAGTHVQPQMQAHRSVIATGLQPGAAPQLAALPSGLTGHLVQIGQQTYLVPQLLNVRQSGGPQLTISQLVGGPPGQTIGTTVGDPKAYTLSSDGSGFQQTQVDGGHDSDDDEGKFCETPSSQQQTPGPSIQVRSVLPQSVQPSDLDDDDDDDDDDLVPATPGFTPSSVRSNQHYQTHRPSGLGGVTPMGGTDTLHRDNLNGVTPLMSGPPTPMTPQSIASRTPADGGTPGWRRLKPATTHGTHSGTTVVSGGGAGASGLVNRKRRHRSPYRAGDTDTELDDDYDECEDMGEEVELMTNATMTPAGHGAELEDEDDDDAERGHKAQVRHSSGAGAARPKANRTQQSSAATADTVPDPVPPPIDAGPDSDLPRDEGVDEEEEEQEEDEEPLNSEDDVSDEEPEVLFESDNVVVCQYDKIHRSRNRWRLNLKDGIMAINGRDHVFQKAVGEAEW